MKIAPKSGPKLGQSRPVLACVMVMPDQVQFDCPACDVTHMLTRDLDFREDPAGVWRLGEQPGFECDCGALIAADFKLTVERTP